MTCETSLSKKASIQVIQYAVLISAGQKRQRTPERGGVLAENDSGRAHRGPKADSDRKTEEVIKLRQHKGLVVMRLRVGKTARWLLSRAFGFELDRDTLCFELVRRRLARLFPLAGLTLADDFR